MSQRFPGRKLSLFRLTVVIAVVALLAGGAYVGLGRYNDAQAASNDPAIFAGYVDVTATPTYAFEAPVSKAAKSVVLSFIVSAKNKPCEPSWGTAYSMTQAGSDLDLDRRMARLVQQGGTVAVSFGGQANDELATGCTDPDQLRDAYASVVDRYSLSTVDLDLEGAGLSDTAAMARRATAIAAVQAERLKAKKPLSVWLTLPVAPTGLTAEGQAAVTAMLAARVDIAGVNAMTMDFGGSKPAGTTMLAASIDAANATHDQLAKLYKAQGQTLGSDTLWRKIGLTPMVGQNDVAGEIFTLQDANGLHSFAVSKGVGRISMWSLNRDATCGPNYPDVARVSDACSGVDQGDQLFSQVLGQGLTTPLAAATTAAPQATARSTQVADNPATSPYPIWSDLAVYVAGDQIVWHGNVYLAKWWTQGDVPDNPVATDGTTPWQLVGPVLPGDKPAPVVTVPAGTYPVWAQATVYLQGDRVMFDGRVFEAKWWTRDDSPAAALQGDPASAWTMLTNAQVQQLLSGKPVPSAKPAASATATPPRTATPAAK
ncbi:glycosyl hydrolase family 18 [Arthrobacter livingstonensis]|uniref:Glycosyl hydrolase family 18 n=1 Tax=Arthrobacter livingstonensis TaxID=670078 RepID=A0A2V5L355_9MICC|nr:chitinase [Arthrobacter livingstonensis]PYI65831.1 glycosyl hydrolase family 18 [Arthrobacter livingstonensis]